MRRPISFGLALALLLSPLLFSPPAQAQSDPAQILQSLDQQSEEFSAQWLASPDPRLRAWGAYEVLRDRQTNQLPTLLSLIASYNPVSGEPTKIERDPHDAMLAILDAAIQLNAEVPAADAAKLYPEFPAQSMILLSNAKEGASRYLLAIFQDKATRQVDWLAAGDLLARGQSREFVSALLGSMVVHASISVTLPNQRERFTGTATQGDRTYEIPKPKPGWPEAGSYVMAGCSTAPPQGGVVLATGIDSVFYYRRVDSNYDTQDYSHFCPSIDFQRLRQHLLDDMTQQAPQNSLLPAFEYERISWRNADDYRARITRFVVREQTAVRRVVALFQCYGVLEPNESLTGPKIEISISDTRPKGSPPLPPLPASSKNVSVSYTK